MEEDALLHTYKKNVASVPLTCQIHAAKYVPFVLTFEKCSCIDGFSFA